MRLLIIGKPHINIFREFRQSETAFDAIRFYEPLESDRMITLSVPGLPNALSLISDLKYFIRKYSSFQFYEFEPEVFCTMALAKSWYQSRELSFQESWRWKYDFVLYPDDFILTVREDDKSEDKELVDEEEQSYLVWCTPTEYNLYKNHSVI